MIEQYFAAIHQIITKGHWITAQVGKALKKYGVTEPQYNVLRTLETHRERPMTVQEILANMVQQNSNVTRIVDKLISQGYVHRAECPSNRRKMDVTITRSGRAMLKKLDRKVLAFHQPMMSKLTPKELKTLGLLIAKLKP